MTRTSWRRDWRYSVLLALFFTLALCLPCWGHVRLTYPPARTYAFDFLDNIRTPKPCGMPKGLGVTTNLTQGSQLFIEWHIAYPHRGGYFVEIMNKNDTVLQRYPNGTLDIGRNDGTSMNYTINLPNSGCDQCTLRLVRQAAEWSAGGNTPYLFWSCADINIVPDISISEKCSNHGTYNTVNGQCACNHLYRGDRCQFKDECDTSNDCPHNGTCVDIGATSYPKKQCYCAAGWFGTSCEKKSAVSTRPKDLSIYQRRVLSDGVTVYYRILEATNEIEVVLQAKTSTWAGFGWRSRKTSSSCRNFPDLTGKHSAGSKSEPDSEGEPEPESEPSSPTEPVAEVTGEPKPEGKAEPSVAGASEPHPEVTLPTSKTVTPLPSAISEPLAEGIVLSLINVTYEPQPEVASNKTIKQGPLSTGEPVSETEPTSKGEPTSEGEPTSKGEPTSEGEPTSKGEPTSEGEPTSKGEPTSEGEPTSKGEPTSEGEPTSKGEPTSEGEPTSKGEPTSEGEPTSGSALHAMDCTDIVIGSARGEWSRVGDFYTRDRSTPVHDEYLGGTNDLTAAMAWEEGNMTVMLFRRKIMTSDPADHSLKNELMHVIWAIGQSEGQYRHTPNSALEAGQASIPVFYKQDELKYHGSGSVQRGVTQINFLAIQEPIESDDCTCKQSVCGLDFSWYYNPSTDLVTFIISANVSQNQWIALGFSDDKFMPNTDVVYGGQMPDGTFIIKDGWLSGRVPPVADDSQDAVAIFGQHANGVTRMSFTRKRTTGDSKDFQFTDTSCPYIMYAKGGQLTSSGSITKHQDTPVVSAERVCFKLKQCSSAQRYTTPASLRLPDLTYKDALADSKSADFKNLASSLQKSLDANLQTILGPKFVSVNVNGFKKGSVIVIFEVKTISINTSAIVKEDVRSALQKAQHFLLGNNSLDPAFLEVFEPYSETEQLQDMESKRCLTEVEIIVITLAIALVIVGIIVGICKCCEIMRTQKDDRNHCGPNQKTHMMIRERISAYSESSFNGSQSQSSGKVTLSHSDFVDMDYNKGQKMIPPYYDNRGIVN